MLSWSRFVDLDFSAARIVDRPTQPRPRARADAVPRTESRTSTPSSPPTVPSVLFERDLPDGTTQIVVVGVDGTGEHVLPLGCVDPCAVDLSPTWAPDGRHVYFTRVVGPFDQVNGSATSAVLWRARLNGQDLTRISQPGIDGAFEEYLATFAPDRIHGVPQNPQLRYHLGRFPA